MYVIMRMYLHSMHLRMYIARLYISALLKLFCYLEDLQSLKLNPELDHKKVGLCSYFLYNLWHT